MLIGIVGKPNVGKSTFFRALTLANVEIANYPFVTIKPNHGIAYVKVECAEKFFGVKCNPREGYCIDGNRFIPVEIIDVAGLVPNAHKGKGMGNQFLDELRQADVLIHVIDVSGSTNENGEYVKPFTYDPGKDIKFLEYEIDMWLYGIFKKVWDKLSRQVMQEHKDVIKSIHKQFSVLKISEDLIKDAFNDLNLSYNLLNWNENDLMKFVTYIRKKSKPIIIAANKIDIPNAEKNLKKLKDEFKDYVIIPCSAESELALKEASQKGLIKYIPGDSKFDIINEKDLNYKQKKALEFIKKNILDKYGSTGVQQIINYAVFNVLNYIYVFPVSNSKLTDKYGNILPDCYLLPPESTVLDLAYKIHTDIGNNFIKGVDLKTKNFVGKEHKLKNGDVIEIITS